MIVTVDLEEDLLAVVAARWVQLFGSSLMDTAASARGYIFLPTRRAATRLTQLLAAALPGQAGILPHVLPMDQLTEDVLMTLGCAGYDEPRETFFTGLAQLRPALSDVRRTMLLARLILRWAEVQTTASEDPGAPSLMPAAEMGLSLRLAETLLGLLDELETDGLPLSALETLAPEIFAEHWQVMLAFLNILLQHWPEILAEEGASDPLARQHAMLTLLADFWDAAPPSYPVWIVGSTGTRPAVARLMSVLAPLENACVVLPGLDRNMDAETWGALLPTHPQFTMMQLLKNLGLGRENVVHWQGPVSTPLRARRVLLEALFAPSDAVSGGVAESFENALDGVKFVACGGASEEAGVAALAIREGLERGLKRIALVTPDRALARMVRAQLTRWGVMADDSAGVPLGETTEGMLVAQALADGAHLTASGLMSILKNPHVGCFETPEMHEAFLAALEVKVLRHDGFQLHVAQSETLMGAITTYLETAQKADPGRWTSLVQGWQTVLKVMTPLPPSGPMSVYVDAHITLLERLMGRPFSAWAETPAGSVVTRLFDEVRHLDDVLPILTPREYGVIFGHLLDGAVVRTARGHDDRVHILGPLEARLLTYELVVITGLNEGVWPRFPAGDPWMSRDMRERTGLPLPERRMGLAAHDFMQVSLSPEVIWTRAQRVAGTPAVPSRWLTRLEIILQRLGRTLPQGRTFVDIWRAQGKIPARGAGIPVTPSPPVALRPRQLSVTQIEMLRRNPYAVYARAILKLKPLRRLDQPLGVAEFGTWLHRRFEALGTLFSDGVPEPGILEAWIQDQWNQNGAFFKDIGTRLFWKTRYERAMGWAAAELAQRPPRTVFHTEHMGAHTFDAPQGPFRLVAVMDRVDVWPSGSTHIVDYKTGALPTRQDVAAGYSPQLPLEGVILKAAGHDVSALAFWHILPQGLLETVSLNDVSQLIQDADIGLQHLIATYDDVAMPYLYAPLPNKAPSYDDYALLSRVGEWGT